ncbi:hypothetical protein [Candidatus Leptofilum sp.]|uniref:hypothetical protein n=1 Tax=Candidatus Leptofilum sp. TaxID=3241576 RepID=UPI003B5C8AE1
MKLDKVIALDETHIDKTAVLQQIEHNLAKRQFTHPASFPTFQLELENLPQNGSLSAELLQKLAQLNEQTSQLWLDPELPPARTATERLLNRLKRPFHQLVIFYVNKMGRQQNEINAQMQQIITQLIAELNQTDPPVDS